MKKILTESVVRRLVVSSVLILFFASLMLPALYTFEPVNNNEILGAHSSSGVGEKRGVYSGGMCLLLGWAGVFFYGVLAIGWYANIFLIPTLIAYVKKHPSSKALSSIALVLAFSSFLFRVMGDIDGGRDEGGIVGGYGLGFYCWLSVYVILAIATDSQYVRASNGELGHTKVD